MHEDLLLLTLNEKWKVNIPFGWIPITGDEKIEDTEIYQSYYFGKYITELKEIIQNLFNVSMLYEVVDGGSVERKIIADCEIRYDGLEYLYTDENCRFVIYCSHESSTTIGGKELIDAIHIMWPEYIEHIWTTPFYD
ncbi:hypothetical protein LBMAG27_22420 [Bacteroidota bacterium]|nr:hypothetical protein LBMAG27_22420 [Bacteroidota bacterium]